jgi:hypothetical protein
MENILAMTQLSLQVLATLQNYQTTVHKALSEGRDVNTADLVTAKASLQTHLDGLQALIDSIGEQER